MVSARICGKIGCWFSCGSLTKGNLSWGFEEAGQPPEAFPCSQGNPRARDKDKAQVSVSIHFFKLVPFQKPVSIVTGNCGTIVKVQKAPARVLARNSAVQPAPEQPGPSPCCVHSGVLLQTPSRPTSHTSAACGLHYPWALQLRLIAGKMRFSKWYFQKKEYALVGLSCIQAYFAIRGRARFEDSFRPLFPDACWCEKYEMYSRLSSESAEEPGWKPRSHLILIY